MKSFKLAAVAAAAALSTAAFADVAFDANYENNTTYTSEKTVSNTKTDSSLGNGGRLEINATATAKNGDYFVSGKGTLTLGQGNNATAANGTDKSVVGGVDDSWIKLGSSAWDVQVGRFEAADLFPMGKDTVVQAVGATGAGGYKANSLRGRIASGQLHTVVGVNAGAARLELGILAQSSSAANTGEVYGLRPTVVFNAGALTLRVGLESIKTNTAGTADQTGYGLSAGFNLAGGSINVNYANNAETKKNSFGVNGTFGAFGVGAVQDRGDGVQQTTIYAAYTLPLFGIKGASVTPAISTSSGTDTTSLNAFRVRLNYGF